MPADDRPRASGRTAQRAAANCGREAQELLEAVGLGHRLKHRRRSSPAAKCSGRPSPGRWPAGPRSCWPTSRPATSTRQRPGVLELLRDLNRERGLTIVLVTHDQAIAQQADRVVRLAEGRIEEWSHRLA